MEKPITTVDEYINSFDPSFQAKLVELRKIILNVVPADSKEIISYAMPTYKWNGNLIHFAQAKNHIGIYPGPAAIDNFKDKLSDFKTSKGAIQIASNLPLPKALIQSIILFNIELLKDKEAPKWDAYRSNWTTCDEFMKQLVSTLKLTKEFKWGNDVYTYKGKNLIAWAGFKNFFSVWFYNGVFLTDKYKVLVSGTEGKTKALRQWRFTDFNQLDEKKILAYIQESIQTIDNKQELIIEKKINTTEPSPYLDDALSNDSILKKAFFSLSAGRQKEYINYINEAKQEKTKQARLEKIRPLILEKKGLNDKYRK